MFLNVGDETDIRGLTALHASSEEVAEWLGQENAGKTDVSEPHDAENRLLQSQEATSSGSNINGPVLHNKPFSSSCGKTKYTFICECFFMTARALNLGLLKAFSDFKHLVQVTKCFPCTKKDKIGF